MKSDLTILFSQGIQAWYHPVISNRCKSLVLIWFLHGTKLTVMRY